MQEVDGVYAGVFLVDKPVGVSSFSVVRDVRRALGIKKVGHAGTLDPFASGLLVICAGRPATKLISGLMDGDKEYFATIRLGTATTTQDIEGEIVSTTPVVGITSEQVTGCLSDFLGDSLQKPPAYSALKHNGKPLYYYARKGIEVIKEPRRIHISAIEWLNSDAALEGNTVDLHVRVCCSRGTYIRTLAADIGAELGFGAHLTLLRRTRSGFFSVDDAFPGEELRKEEQYMPFRQSALSVDYIRNLLQ